MPRGTGRIVAIIPRGRCAVYISAIAAALLVGPGSLAAQEADAEALAMELANPIAALISLPVQANWDRQIGSLDDGTRLTVNVQPVIPVSLSEDWNLISRTILPIVWQDEIVPAAGSQFGLGDIVQSVFFSPVAPVGGWIVGFGPVFLLPTGTDDLLSAKKFGLGPTAVALKQQGPLTFGALVNHVVSVAGDDARGDVSATFLQPFFSYTTPTAWTFTVQTETTYDWEAEQFSVPLGLLGSKVVRLGGRMWSLGGGLRYWADGPAGGPEGLAFRGAVTLLLPR